MEWVEQVPKWGERWKGRCRWEGTFILMADSHCMAEANIIL